MHSTKAPRPLGERARARRDRLLQVARTLFIEQGFHQTGTAQIAAASGIAVGQMYRDFKNKDAIIPTISEADAEPGLGEQALADAEVGREAGKVRVVTTVSVTGVAVSSKKK